MIGREGSKEALVKLDEVAKEVGQRINEKETEIMTPIRNGEENRRKSEKMLPNKIFRLYCNIKFAKYKVRPVLYYGSETWTMRQSRGQKFNNFEH